MKNLLLGFALLLASVSIATAQEATPPTNTDAARAAAGKILIANEHALHEAIKNRDAKAFTALVSSDGIWADGGLGGFVPIKALTGGLGAFNVLTSDIVNPNIFWIDDRSAIVNYAWSGKKSFQDRPLAANRVASTVWARRGDTWVAVYHHESDLAR